VDSVEQNTTPTVSFTYAEDGVAVNPSPDSATITVTRADGTALHTDAATTDGGTGIFRYVLSASDTSLLDVLTLEWHIGTQTFTTKVQVQGGFYFTIAEALALPELASHSAADVAAGRTLAEEAFEHATGYAFVPRYTRQTLSATQGTLLRLPMRPLRAIRAVDETTSLGGTPATLATTGYARASDGVYRPCGWTPGPNNVVVGYEYGADEPPERVKRAVLLLAKNWLVNGPIDDRATAIPAGEAGGVITLATPGIRGANFGIPEVDAVVEQYRIKQSIYSVPLTRAENTYFDTAWPGW
jgi:hypothetical protein